MIVDRLNFLTDLVVGVQTDLMSKSERINLREILDLVVRKPQIWQLIATSSRLQLLHHSECANVTRSEGDGQLIDRECNSGLVEVFGTI